MKPDTYVLWTVVIAAISLLFGAFLGSIEHLGLLKAAKEFVTTIGICCGVAVAWLGLRAWKIELHGKSKYATAKELWENCLIVRDTLERARSPFNLEYEIGIGEHIANAGIRMDPNLTASQKADRIAESYTKAWRERREPVFKAMAALQIISIEVEVNLGDEGKELIDNVLACGREYYIAVEERLQDVRNDGAENEISEKLRAVLSSNKLANDAFSQSVSSAIGEVKTYAQRIMNIKYI